jgi:hypothetical protein
MKLNSIFESGLKILEFEKCVKNRDQNIFKLQDWGSRPHPKKLQINFTMSKPRFFNIFKMKNHATLVQTLTPI